MSESQDWQPVRIQLVVTGHCETKCAVSLVGKIFASADRAIQPLKSIRTDQRPRQRIDDLARRQRGAVGAIVPLKQHLAVIRELGKRCSDGPLICIVLDDLERNERANAQHHYAYFRSLVDKIPAAGAKERASVHFFVNMVEAYFFADTNATNRVVKNLHLAPHDGDVENIDHPKDELAARVSRLGTGRSYGETEHAPEIMRRLDLEQVLESKDRCRALRTLVAWCWEAIGEPRSDKFRLTDGVYWDITAGQLSDLPSVERIGPLAAEESYQPLQN